MKNTKVILLFLSLTALAFAPKLPELQPNPHLVKGKEYVMKIQMQLANNLNKANPSTTFSQTVTIPDQNGVVPAITGVPTTGSLTTPNFTFTIVAGAGVNSTNGPAVAQRQPRSSK